MKTKISTLYSPCSKKLLAVLVLVFSFGISNGILAQTSGQRCFEGPNTGCQTCLLSYPDNSNLPRSAVVFNESSVLVAADPGPSTCGAAQTQIKLWYTDEHALTLGVRQVIIKHADGTTTTTNYPVTATPASPTCQTSPQVGTTIQTGDQSGNDVADGGGRPLWPVLYITDLTVNGATSRIGDWQQGGTGFAPGKVCGTWKAAVKTVDYTHSPAKITITPDDDPARNHQDLGGGDAFPAGSHDDGFGAEVVWNISDLGLLPGHTYRLQFMIHDGDQNKAGGDAGESCTTVVMPAPGGALPAVSGTTTWTSDNVNHTVTIRTSFSKAFIDNTYGTNAIGWPSPAQTFSNLVNGDNLRLGLYDANGALKMDFALDYFSASNTVASGYKSLGTGGDGHLYTGTLSDIISYKTSMDSNFNDNNYILTANSPSTNSSYTPNATYPKWNYDVWYQVTVKQSAFGAAGFGYPAIPDIHANPSKSGAADVAMTQVDCPAGTVTVGDLVWDDKNLNGHHDMGEPGIYGAVVRLYQDANNDNVPDGAPIASTVTDANGMYKFSGLPAGNYIVGVVLPYNTSLVPTNGGDPDNNINDDNNGVSVVNGEARSLAITLAPGTEPTNDGDGPDGNLTLDFALVTNYGAIGDFVWNDLNKNGKQDLGEPGIANVLVKLYDCAGNLIQTTVTDSLGEYLFINVPASTAGTGYKVQFSNLPQFYVLTSKTKTGVAVDVNSKPDSLTGFTDCFLLHAGEANVDVDAGAYNTATPNLTPTIEYLPNVSHGVSTIGIVTSVYEIKNVATTGLIQVYVTKDPKYTVTYSQASTVIGGRPVHNNVWTLDNTNPNFYIFSSTAVIPGDGSTNFGFNVVFNPNNSNGQTTISAFITTGSGGEKVTDSGDNHDDDVLIYFFN